MMWVSNTIVSLLLYLAFLLSLSTLSLSTEPSHVLKTTTLDVAAALSATRQVLSSSSVRRSFSSSLRSFAAASSGIALELRPRESLKPSGHRDYKALTLNRLKRDIARVQSLNARLAFHLKGVGNADFKPEGREGFVSAEELQGRVISGLNHGSGEYFSRVGIGSPARPLYVTLDTGSDITWVQCQPCSDCYEQVDPVFDPAGSTTYAPVACNSSHCQSLDVSACRDGVCQYQVNYGDGSYTVGNLARDTLTFGPGLYARGITLGCGHDNYGLFRGAAGLFGLGRGPLSFPSQLSASLFSYCLVDRDSDSVGMVMFGRGSLQDPDSLRVPLLRNGKMPSFYYVGLSGISVGGSRLAIQPSAFQMDGNGTGGAIVDTGTAVTRLPVSVYQALRDAFTRATTHLPQATGVSLFDTCYNLSSLSKVDVATVEFHFDSGESLQFPAKNYLVPTDSAGTFCLAFATSSVASGLTIIGNVQQQGMLVSFDSANSLVGFSPDRC
ncbi:protein ASPARTIC PROTEASE IN GUARD CELL 1-like [Nymphaea colorata]|uniref:Peptidase A1 domain-containing protein n=1 Tax=Nymphaea colorata TaxID=210225 RepID=A0A5K0ZTA6_9MAGN|nr:protein ASPARTIC PROTEASE IN GUARD CELL 1-like [Nymphaea colorata]